MNDRKLSLGYINSVLYDLEKAFWDERGRGARFRVTTVGREYFLDKCLPKIQSQDLDAIIKAVEDVLTEEGIVLGQSHLVEDRLLHIRVEGCLHQDVERKLAAKDVEPFTCIPANLVALAIEQVLRRPVELAEIKLEDGACSLLLVLFEPRDVDV
jgi:hypothetical protein